MVGHLKTELRTKMELGPEVELRVTEASLRFGFPSFVGSIVEVS